MAIKLHSISAVSISFKEGVSALWSESVMMHWVNKFYGEYRKALLKNPLSQSPLSYKLPHLEVGFCNKPSSLTSPPPPPTFGTTVFVISPSYSLYKISLVFSKINFVMIISVFETINWPKKKRYENFISEAL